LREDQCARLSGRLPQEPKIHTRDRARERRFPFAGTVIWLE
jgi:hypothetical protein